MRKPISTKHAARLATSARVLVQLWRVDAMPIMASILLHQRGHEKTQRLQIDLASLLGWLEHRLQHRRQPSSIRLRGIQGRLRPQNNIMGAYLRVPLKQYPPLSIISIRGIPLEYLIRIEIAKLGLHLLPRDTMLQMRLRTLWVNDLSSSPFSCSLSS